MFKVINRETRVEIVTGLTKYVRECISDENAYMEWIEVVPDQATAEDFEDIADDEELFQETIELFVSISKRYEGDK